MKVNNYEIRPNANLRGVKIRKSQLNDIVKAAGLEII